MADDYDPLAQRPDAVTNALADVAIEFRALAWPRIAATLGFLSILLLGHFIPLYGLSTQSLTDLRQFSGAIDRISLMALGVMPWVSAVILIETVGLFIPPLRKSLGFRDGHCDPFYWFVILLAIILGAMQAYGIDITLSASGMMNETGPLSSLMVISSLIAGTLVTVAIAQLINRYGTGFGFWLVFGFSLPFAMPKALTTIFDLARSGSIELAPALLTQVVTFVAITLVAVVLTRCLFHKGIMSPARLVFPLMIGGHLASYILAFTSYVTGNQLSAYQNSYIYVAAACAGTAILLVIYLREILNLKVLVFAILALCAYHAMPYFLAEFGIVTGWYWQASIGQTLAFIASITFIISGVYGRRSVVGNP